MSSNLAGSAIYDVNRFAATLARLGLDEMAVPRLALCRVPAVRHRRRGPQAFAAVASRKVERGRQQSRGSLSGCGPSSCRPERASRPVRRGNPYLAVGGAAPALALSDSTVKRLLAGRAIVYVGTISYSLYLSHFVTPDFAFYGEMPTFNLVAVVCHAAHFLTAFALAVTLATGIYRLVEAPGRRVMRAAAGRLPGLGRPTRIAREQAEPAG